MNKPILITGCQRSGTTLLHLILNSHPKIHSIDESGYAEEKVNDYLESPDFHPFVCLKLPRFASNLACLTRYLSELRVLWCIRDPRDVIASMVNLHVKLNDVVSVSWLVHPGGAKYEFDHCLPVLDEQTKQELSIYQTKYRKIEEKLPALRSREEAVFAGAFCWRIKNELLKIYERENIAFEVIKYETLVKHPKEEIKKALDFLNIPWHRNVLRHHRLHKGIHMGKTDYSKPIDSNNVGKWRTLFSKEELELINELTSPLAEGMGYKLV
jgi:protein-tyrosine sulfotransferase